MFDALNPAVQSVAKMELELESPRNSMSGQPHSSRHAVGPAQLSGHSPGLWIDVQNTFGGIGNDAASRIVCQQGPSASVP